MGTCDLAAVKKSTSESDRQLISRAQNGDEEAFAALFDTHKRRVYSLCLQMTGDVTEAEDLTQDAFIQVFRKLNTFRGDAAFSTWLYRVALNTVLMKLRRRRPRQISLDEPIGVNSNSSFVPREYGRKDPHLQGAVDRISLLRAIKELPDGYRTIFVLHDVEGYDHREIAQMLRCSTGNSKSQLHKARLKIRELLLTAKSLASQTGSNARINRAATVAMTREMELEFSRPTSRTPTVPQGYEEL